MSTPSPNYLYIPVLLTAPGNDSHELQNELLYPVRKDKVIMENLLSPAGQKGAGGVSLGENIVLPLPSVETSSPVTAQPKACKPETLGTTGHLIQRQVWQRVGVGRCEPGRCTLSSARTQLLSAVKLTTPMGLKEATSLNISDLGSLGLGVFY